MKEVVIISAVRTPMGSFCGKLSQVSATELGSIAIKGAIKNAKISKDIVDEVFMGNVLQANLGQAPAKQSAIMAGLKDTVPCTTINKVCSSGMKSIMIAAQSIIAGDNEIVIAGGMENMSNVPHYLNKVRTGQKLGDVKVIDGLIKDGLTDVYNNIHMGVCAEKCASEMSFSREQQDNFAIESYNKSTNANLKGNFKNEIVPVEIKQRNGNILIIDEDEEIKKIDYDLYLKIKAMNAGIANVSKKS